MSAKPRLYLLTPPLGGDDLPAFAPRFGAALAAGDVACALLRLKPGAEGKRIVTRLLEIASGHDTALLIEDPRLAARLGADGVHVSAQEVAEAVESANGERIVGAGGLALRDDAMSAAEAGADYVMFGEPDSGLSAEAKLERVAWWGEIFETPCVAYAETLDEVAPLAQAGADFVALGAAVFEAEDPAQAVLTAMRGLGR